MTDTASILVVDDSADALVLAVRLLSAEGYVVRPADSGELALAAVESQRPDLVLLDVRMPGMDGLEVLRRLKELPEAEQMPVILVSGFATAEEWAHGLQAGAADYVTKPFRPAELMTRVRTQLALRAARRSAERHVHELRATAEELAYEGAERERAQEALRLREAFYREQFDRNPMVTLLLDPEDGRIVLVNAAAVSFYGYPHAQLLAMNVRDLNGMALDEAARIWRQVLDEGGLRYEVQHRLADGTSRTMDVLATPVQLGGRTLLQCHCEDITARREAEAALRKSEHDLREAERVAHVGHWTWNTRQNTVTWSDEMKRIWGLDPQVLHGDLAAVISERVHPDDRPLVEASNAAVLNDAKPMPLEYRIVLPNGDVRDLLAVPGEAQKDAAGNVLQLAGIVHDITAEREAERASARLVERLSHAQQLESVGRLAGGVAHEFNNKLAVILGNLEFALAALPPGSQVHTDLLAVREAAQRSAELTQQLLAFARKQAISPTVLDLNEVVANSLQLLRPLLGTAIDMAWEPSPDLWDVRIDAAQLTQVMALLTVNARDAIGDVGRLTVRTSNRTVDAAFAAAHAGAIEGEFACLSVEDTGVGMTPEVMQHLFEPFYTTKGLAEGTGLGLATVYGAVSQNGGFVLVESAPNHGARFDLYLPRAVGAAVAG